MVAVVVTLDKGQGGTPGGDGGRAGLPQTGGASQGEMQRRAVHMEGSEQARGTKAENPM